MSIGRPPQPGDTPPTTEGATASPGGLRPADVPPPPAGPPPARGRWGRRSGGDSTPTADESSTPLEIPHTRTSATYVGIAVVLVLLVIILDFIIQNLHSASVHLFTLRVSLPVGLLILIAAVTGGIVVLVVSLARVAQLRLMARRHRKGESSG